MNGGRVRVLWQEREVRRQFRTGVSLHSHTMHSRENLAFIPRYAARIPLLGAELRRVAKRYHAKTGRELDYARGYFTPPLPARAAFELESRNIEQALGMRPLVSLSDHDDIEAGLRLRAEYDRDAPISIEWTFPVGSTYFHIGVHNLPEREALTIQASMAACTQTPSETPRNELLAYASGFKETLVVLNHPLWDQAGVGQERHREALVRLLRQAGPSIHALELNGLRSWPENRFVLEIARAAGLPAVSGGDRHGCHANATANLTNAASFSEFAAEVRDGASELVLLDDYRVSLGARILRGICDIMGYHPELGSRAHWSDRVYVRRFSDAIVPLSQAWDGEFPGVVRCFDGAMRLAGTCAFQRLMRLCFSNGHDPRVDEPPYVDTGFEALVRAAAAPSRREESSP